MISEERRGHDYHYEVGLSKYQKTVHMLIFICSRHHPDPPTKGYEVYMGRFTTMQ